MKTGIKASDDIFKKALAATTEVLQEVKDTLINVEGGLPAPIVKVKTWSQMKKAMDNEHAEKFNSILSQLPDREFVRVYLKAMEFFKPKVIRVAGDRGDKVDKTINIQINLGKQE